MKKDASVLAWQIKKYIIYFKVCKICGFSSFGIYVKIKLFIASFIVWAQGIRHDIQYNDTQHNATQHNDILHNDTQHYDTKHNNKKCDSQGPML